MKNLKKKFFDYFHRESTTKFQIVSQIITLIFLAFLTKGAISISYFNSADPKPEIEHLTPQQKTEAGGATTLVKTGCYVKDFITFDPIKNNFVIDITLWFSFDPHALSLDVIDKFSFRRGTILRKSFPEKHIIEGKLFVSYDIRIQFSSNLSYKYFPFNDHQIYLILTNEFVNFKEVIYIGFKSGISVSPEIYTGGWTNVDSSVDFGYSEIQFEKNDKKNIVQHPLIIFSFDYAQTGVKNIFLILVPLLLMYFMSFFSLSLNVRVQENLMMTLSIGAITALLAYRFVIEQLAPNVSYFVISDYLYLFFLCTSFLVFLFNLLLIRLHTIPFALKIVRICMTLICHALLIILFYFLLYVWGR